MFDWGKKMIKLYIYEIATGLLVKESAGNPDGVLQDMQEGEDFTLVPVPDYDYRWRWLDDKWVKGEAILPDILPMKNKAIIVPTMSELMGEPKLSYKKLEAVLNANTDAVSVAHGVDATKILGASVTLKDEMGALIHASDSLLIKTDMECVVITGATKLGLASDTDITILLTYEVA